MHEHVRAAVAHPVGDLLGERAALAEEEGLVPLGLGRCTGREIRQRRVEVDLQPAPRSRFRRVDDDAVARRRAAQPLQDRVRVSDGRAQADALHVVRREARDALEDAHQVRAAVQARHRVHFVDDHVAQVAEELRRRHPRRDEHHLQRLRRGHQEVRRLAQELLARARPDIAVPDEAVATDHLRVEPEALRLVVQERLDRRDVDGADRVTRPGLLEQVREHGEHRRLGLAAGGGRQDDGVLPVEDGVARLLLDGTQRAPPEPRHDGLLEPRREARERALCAHHWALTIGRLHRPLILEGHVVVVVVDRRRPLRESALLLGAQILGREAVGRHRVVARVVVDQVELVDELPQELPRHDADVALEALGDLVHQPLDELVGDPRFQQGSIAGRIELAQPQRHGPEALGVEGRELELRLAQARLVAALQELDAVVERREPRHAPALVEEVGCPREDPEQPGIAAGRVGDLPDPVERLVARVLPHAEDGLGLVDDDQHPQVVGGLHDLEHAAEVVERVAAADVALDLRRLLRRRGHLLAPAEPGDERAGFRHLASLLEVEDGLDDADEVLGRLAPGARHQIVVEPRPHLVVEVGGVLVLARLHQPFFDPADPAVEDVAERTARAGRGAELGQHLAVDVVEAMELEVVVGDDHEARREAPRLRVEDGEPRHERLAAPVAAAEELDRAFAALGHVELAMDLPALRVDPDRERLDAPLGHEPFAELLEDVLDIPTCRRAHDYRSSRTYRFTPRTTSMRTSKGTRSLSDSNFRAKRRSAR